MKTSTHYTENDKAGGFRMETFEPQDSDPLLSGLQPDLRNDHEDRLGLQGQELMIERRLKRLNPELEILSIGQGKITVKASSFPCFPELPEGYGFKGGVARYKLHATLGILYPFGFPRDIDIIDDGTVDSLISQKLARLFMPEDVIHGYGVETVEDVDEYLSSRDLTINEVLSFSDRITFSYQCLEDSTEQVLRATPCQVDAYGAIKGKIAMKMVRLAAEAEFKGYSYTIENVDDTVDVGVFDIALHLDRAIDKGEEVALNYIRKSIELGLLRETEFSSDDVSAVVRHCADRLYEGLSFFRHLPHRLKLELADDLRSKMDTSTGWMDVYDQYVFREGVGRRYATKNLSIA